MRRLTEIESRLKSIKEDLLDCETLKKYYSNWEDHYNSLKDEESALIVEKRSILIANIKSTK